MRYSEIDLQCEDIMWFGVDVNGYIVAFTSGGYGCIPEYVCRSREETERLEEFFMEELEFSTDSKMEVSLDGSPLANDAQVLARKGLFVYDVSFEEDHDREYSIIATPSVPLDYKNLPINISEVLKDHIIEYDATCSTFIRVNHSY